MNKNQKALFILATSVLLFASVAAAQPVTDLPRLSTTQVLKSGIYPRELTELNGQVYFTAQDDTASSAWNRRYLWSSMGSREKTSIVPPTQDVRAYPGVIPGYGRWEAPSITPGRELVTLGSNLLLSTLDSSATRCQGTVALFNPTNSTVASKPVELRDCYRFGQFPTSARERLNLYKAGDNAYTVVQGELFSISAEPFSVTQLTTARSTANNNRSDPGRAFVSAFAPVGSSIVYGVTQQSLDRYGEVDGSRPRPSMLYSFNGKTHNKLNPFEIGSGTPVLWNSSPEAVDVWEQRTSAYQGGGYLGRLNSTSLNISKLNFAPLSPGEEVIYSPQSFTPSDSPFLFTLTRGRQTGTRLWQGRVSSNNSVSWSVAWNGVEDLFDFGYIEQVKVFQGNVFLKYMMGQIIVVRSDGSWRYVASSDPDYQFVKLVVSTKELVKVGKLWFFSSADGSDLGVANEVPATKPSAWIPSPKSRVAAPKPTAGASTRLR